MSHRSIVIGLVFGVASTVSILTAIGQDRFPDGPGKAPLVKICSGCHDAEIVLANLKTPDEWNDTLQTMAEQGAEGTPEDWRLIAQYLDANLALIRVNKAPADELQLTIDVPADIAAAIVKHRQQKGPFTSIDDLKKVTGIDAAKVEQRAKRFVF